MALMAMNSPLIAGGYFQEDNMAVRAITAITAIRAFYLKGQVVSIGETVTVKDSVASELISSNKAVPAVEVKEVIAPAITDVITDTITDTPNEHDITAESENMEPEKSKTDKPKWRGGTKNVR